MIARLRDRRTRIAGLAAAVLGTLAWIAPADAQWGPGSGTGTGGGMGTGMGTGPVGPGSGTGTGGGMGTGMGMGPVGPGSGTGTGRYWNRGWGPGSGTGTGGGEGYGRTGIIEQPIVRPVVRRTVIIRRPVVRPVVYRTIIERPVYGRRVVRRPVYVQRRAYYERPSIRVDGACSPNGTSAADQPCVGPPALMPRANWDPVGEHEC